MIKCQKPWRLVRCKHTTVLRVISCTGFPSSMGQKDYGDIVLSRIPLRIRVGMKLVQIPHIQTRLLPSLPDGSFLEGLSIIHKPAR